MDLNDKIEARRREIAVIAARAKADELERAAALKRQAESDRIHLAQAEAAALSQAVQNRLKEQNIQIPVSISISEDKVTAEIELLVDKAAAEKMTKSENKTFAFLLVVAVISIIFSWWLAAFFVIAAFVYLHKVKEKYKAEILKSSKASQQTAAAAQGSEQHTTSTDA